MTLPDERYRSIKQTREFLWRLAGGEFARVPRDVRRMAEGCLRHFPSEWELDRLAEASPDIVARRMEPLHRMILDYEQNTQEPVDKVQE